jgi:site-specific recombinase XerD
MRGAIWRAATSLPSQPEAGVDLFTIGKILGHSSPATTARYSHLNDASLKKAMAKLL